MLLLISGLEPIIAERAKVQQGTRSDLLQNSAKSSDPIDTRAELASPCCSNRSLLKGQGIILGYRRVKVSRNLVTLRLIPLRQTESSPGSMNIIDTRFQLLAISCQVGRVTKKAIGERIGWSEEKVNQYSALLKNILTDILLLTKDHQVGRVSKKLTTVSFDFTEWWFRNSAPWTL